MERKLHSLTDNQWNLMDILSSAMGSELLKSGLFTSSQLDQLLSHAKAFPAYPLNRLFLEYQVKDGLHLEGYGHGYSLQQFGELVAADKPRLPLDHAKALQDALRCDPFLEERGYYLERRNEVDPEWIEYDWANSRFLDTPAVFFTVPTRLQSFSTPERLAKLSFLNQDTRSQDLLAFLGALRDRTPSSLVAELAIYRIGLSEARAPGWMKLVVSGIDIEAMRGALSIHKGIYLDVFAPVAALYGRFGAVEQAPIIAASIDSLHGSVHGVDVECPYFNGLKDADTRREAVRVFVATLVDVGLLPRKIADVIAASAYREFRSADQAALLTLNHFKFGIAGSTRGRLKLYFELMTRGNDA